MKPEVELRNDEMSKVVKVYRKYDSRRGKWYESDIALPGYDIVSYKATKPERSLYYSTYEEAEQRAEQYNKHLRAYKKGRQPSIGLISWYDFNGTELHNDMIWWHDSGSWLYAHGYDDWDPEELLQNTSEVTYPYDDYDHTTVNFFEVLFTTAAFAGYTLKQDRDGRYKIYTEN